MHQAPDVDPTRRVEVVIATRDRRDRLLATLDRLVGAGWPVTVVDDGSTDGTAAATAAAFPGVGLLRLPRSRGAAARNVGVRAATAPYVAFCDDDSWWPPGSLERAADVLDAWPHLAVLVARVEVGEARRPDPLCPVLATSPLGPRPGAPTPRVLGFLACGAVVRRSAFLEVGGFARRFGVGGEEQLLAIDLACRGWWCSYVDDVVAVHDPAPRAASADRQVRQARNALWSAWLRRPLRAAARQTGEVLKEAARQGLGLRVAGAALAGLPVVAPGRRAVPAAVEADLRALEGPGAQPGPGAPGHGRGTRCG